MTEALTYLYYIFDKFTLLVFDVLQIEENVSIGWIIVVVILFGLIIKSVLNIPRGIQYRTLGLKQGRGSK